MVVSRMSKNGYLSRQKARDDAIKTAQTVTMTQYMIEIMTVTLNDPEYMGNDAFGYERIRRIADGMQKNYDTYFEALTLGTEADYYRSKPDEALRRIIRGKEEFKPFEERYPYLPQIKYTK